MKMPTLDLRCWNWPLFGRMLLVSIVLLLLEACSKDDKLDVETMRITEEDFLISLVAEGELQAAQSTAIYPPSGSPNPRTIAWLAPNNSSVKTGDLIAKFDITDAEQGAFNAGIELDKIDIQLSTKERELQRLLSELGGELELVDIEKILANQFAVEDNLAYSRHEIIDATRDRELLEYRAGHFESKKSIYSDRENAEIDVLDALRSKQETESQENQLLIQHSEVRAPHDGLLVYEKNWWGQPIGVGSPIFPANKFASIPNLESMEAKLWVLETEAIGIAPGQSVEMTVDAYPDRLLTGKIKNISATSAPIEKDSPVNYFSVIVALDQSDPQWITPNSPVTAKIEINVIKKTISVPNQVLFHDESGDWVLVRNGGTFTRRSVVLGMRGANRSQIKSGLETGEEIALYPPQDLAG